MPPPKTEPAPGPASDLTRWFAEEVHPHDASLRAYLRGAFPGVRDVDDVVQESYLRVWRTRAAQPIQSARAFLFRVARNLALDLVRRNRAAPFSPVRDLEGLSVLDHGSSPVRALDTHEKLMMLADAIEALPARCREVVILRKIQGLPQREVATQLGLAEKTVEAQLARGISRCEDYLRARGVRGCYDHV
jgi:RNA polymerase sigma-70 factor (ECF subfamily)